MNTPTPPVSAELVAPDTAALADLVERLQSHMGLANMQEVLADARKAADTITDLRQALAASAAREERMRVALEPFSKLEEPERRIGNAAAYSIRFTDIRRALTALSQEAET